MKRSGAIVNVVSIRTLHRLIVYLAAIVVVLGTTPRLSAQSQPAADNTVVPHLMKYSGTITDSEGNAQSGTVGVTFALYKEQEGGSPLWLETQNIQTDSSGHYTATLGSSRPEGLPTDMFASGEARWLGVQVQGQQEQTRALLVAVPYALKAADAATIGGLPPSVFVRATPEDSSSTSGPSSQPASFSSPTSTGGSVSAANSRSSSLSGSGATNFSSNLDIGAQINAALAKCGSRGPIRCDVHIPCGSYTLSTQILISGVSYVTLRSANPACALVTNTITGMPAEAAIKINNSTDIDISGLNIVGASNTGNAISIMNGSQRVRIHDNRFGSTTGSGKDGQGQPMNAAGVYVSSSLFTDIFQNTFFGNAQGLVFDAASGVINASKVNKNWFSAQVNDGFVEKGNFASYGLEFKGNSVESSGGYGVNLWSGGGWEFGGNYFESNTLGEMNFGNTCVGVGIHGNLISSLATLGPMIAITSSGAKSSGFDMSGNQIDIASSSGTMAAAITVDLNDSIIHDNSANLVGGTITDLVKISTGALRVAVWNNNKNPGSAGTVTNLLHDIPAGVTSTGPLFWLREIPLGFAGTTFGSLPASSNGTIIYCSDCKIASSCAPGGTGAFAKRLNGAWVCN